MFNLFDDSFINDIVSRMMHWVNFHASIYKDDGDLGVFATLYQMNYCRNTGIYNKEFNLINDDIETHFFFPGFDWTHETLRGELIKKLKDFQINNKIEAMKNDFV
jgi:hypothetical protein